MKGPGAAAAGLAGALSLLSGGAPAEAEQITLSLSTHRVAIGSNYTGADLVLFGVIERDAQTADRPGPFDLVVTVRGPRETLTVRRKEELGPVWINRAQQKFASVPTILIVLASRRIAEIAGPDRRARLRLGLYAIVEAPEFLLDRGEADDPYRAALIRLKTKDGLWRQSERGVTFVTPAVFRAPIPLPGTAPIGNYEVEALLLADGLTIGRREASFEVVKSGFEERVTTMAQERGLPYGLAVAALSLGFGWLASVIFRRD